MVAHRIMKILSAALFGLPAAFLVCQPGCHGQWPPGNAAQTPATSPAEDAWTDETVSSQASDVLAALAKSDQAYKYAPARRYNAPIHGFSLCPPEGMERMAISSGKSGATAVWTYEYPMAPANSVMLSVHRATKEQVVDLDKFAKALPVELGREEQFQTDSTRIDKVCGKPVIYLSGRRKVKGIHQHYAWILTDPDSFLVIKVVGTETLKNRTEKTFRGAIDGLKIIDRNSAIAARNLNLERGEALLGTITAAKIAAAIEPADSEWFIIRKDNNDVGFMWRQFAMSRRENTNGFVVNLFVSFRQDKLSRLMKIQDMFATPERLKEKWVERQRQMTGSDEVSGWAECLLVQDLIKFHAIYCAREISHTYNLPQLSREPESRPDGSPDKSRPVIRKLGNAYLPRAMAVLLPALIDLNKPASYSFATYSGEINSLELFTLTVAGRQTITMDGKAVQAFRLTQQDKDDSDENSLWVDSAGKLLRIVDAEGFVTERSTEKAVLNLFPTAIKDMAETADPNVRKKTETPGLR
ncbi:MAG: hypothetical protein HZA50_05060 [Planctomycetes bacterium]|nr:hypothetical protein [Planctomycetota bacterium]